MEHPFRGEQEAARVRITDAISRFPETLDIFRKSWEGLKKEKIKQLDKNPDLFPEVKKMREVALLIKEFFNQSNFELAYMDLPSVRLDEFRKEWLKMKSISENIFDLYSGFIGDRKVKMRRDGFVPHLSRKIEELSTYWENFQSRISLS